MAGNTNNPTGKQYMFRELNTKDISQYNYFSVTEDKLDNFRQQHPTSQIVYNNNGNIDIARLDEFDNLRNAGLLDGSITDNALNAFDENEKTNIKAFAPQFRAIREVLNDYGIAEGSPMYNLIVYTAGYESKFGKAGYKSKTGAKGLMQITKTTFDDFTNRHGNDQYFQFIKEKYNNGNDFTHEDVMTNDKLSVALALEIYRERIPSRAYTGISFDDLKEDDLAYVYAKCYNTGDRQQLENGEWIGHTVSEHTRLLEQQKGSFHDTFRLGMAYLDDLDYNDEEARRRREELQRQKEEEQARQARIAEGARIAKLYTVPSVDEAEHNEELVREYQSELLPENERAVIQGEIKELVDGIANNVELETQQKVAQMAANQPFGALSDQGGMLLYSSKMLGVALESNVDIQKQAGEKLYEYIVGNSSFNNAIQIRTQQILANDKNYNGFMSSLNTSEIETELNNFVTDNNLGANSTEEEVLSAISDKEASVQAEIDNMLSGMSDEEKEQYERILETQELAGNAAFDDVFNALLPIYESYLNDALMDRFAPKNNAEYLMSSAIANSIIGHVLLSSASREAKDIFDMGLANYDASWILSLVGGAMGMFLDMPAFNAFGAIGSAAFKGLGALTKLVTNKAILTTLTKGKNIVQGVTKVLPKSTRNVLSTRINANAINRTSRLLDLSLKQLTTSKGVTFAYNMGHSAVSGGFSFAGHSFLSQYTKYFDMSAVDWKEVGYSGILGTSMSVFHPFKEMLPATFQKALGGSKHWLPKSLNRTLQPIARVGFVSMIEAPAFGYVDAWLRNETENYNYFSSVIAHAPMFLILGAKHLLGKASLYRSTDGWTHGFTAPWRNMFANREARMTSEDFDALSKYTGKKIRNMSDILKLSDAEKRQLEHTLNSSSEIPISLKSKYIFMTGMDTQVTIPIFRLTNKETAYDRILQVESTIERTKDGTYVYRETLGEDVLVEQPLHGYDAASAYQYRAVQDSNRLKAFVIDTSDAVRDLSGLDSYMSRTYGKLNDVLSEFGYNNPYDSFESNFQRFETDAIRILEKPVGLRTDSENAVLEQYTSYINTANRETSRLNADINTTATLLNIPRERVMEVLRMNQLSRSGADAGIAEVFNAIYSRQPIPENAIVKAAQEQIEAKVRQKEENKAPVQLTPTEEAVYLSRMTLQERIEYANRHLVSADGSVEVVSFKDGTDVIRVTEPTGAVIYREPNGKEYKPSDEQLREYETNKDKISLKLDSKEIAQSIVHMQDARNRWIERAANNSESPMEGLIEYRNDSGISAYGEADKLNANGDIILKDGTVVKWEDVINTEADLVTRQVEKAVSEPEVPYVPEGKTEMDRPTDSYWKSLQSKSIDTFIRLRKLWYPDENLMAVIESRISKLRRVVDKANAELESLTKTEQSSGDTFTNVRSRLESERDAAISELERIESTKDKYIEDYPLDKTHYDMNMREQAKLQEAEAQRIAEEKKQAKNQKELERAKQEAEKAREKAEKAREKAEKAKQKRDEKNAKRLEREAQAEEKKAEKKRKEYEEWWEKRFKEQEIEEERLTNMGVDKQIDFLHMLLNIFQLKKGKSQKDPAFDRHNINQRFNLDEFTRRMKQFFPEFTPEQLDRNSALMLAEAVVRNARTIRSMELSLERSADSTNPSTSIKATKNRTTIENNIAMAKEQLNDIVAFLETVGERQFAANGDKTTLNVVRKLRRDLAENRSIANSVMNLFEIKADGKPIITEERTNKRKKSEPTDDVKETQSVEVDGEQVEVSIEVANLDIAPELKEGITEVRDEATPTAEPAKTEPTAPVETPKSNESVEVPESPKEESPKTEEAPKASPKKETPKKAPKTKKAVKITVKKEQEKATESPASESESAPESAPVPEPIKKGKNKKNAPKKEVPQPTTDATPAPEVVAQTEAPATVSRVTRVLDSTGLKFLMRKKGKGEVIDGTKGDPKGWVEEAKMELDIEGTADNNTLGTHWEVLQQFYGSKNMEAFVTGDEVRITKKPVIEVEITYNGDGTIKSISPIPGEKIAMGIMEMTPMREKVSAGRGSEIKTIQQKLHDAGISIVWGNRTDFSSAKQESFYDSNRGEIVLNPDINLSEAAMVRAVLGHEAAHGTLNHRSINARQNIVKNVLRHTLGEEGTEGYNKAIQDKKKEYADGGVEITDKQAEIEIVAEFIGRDLFSPTETGNTLNIRQYYENLRTRESDILTALRKKQDEALREELTEVRDTMQFIEELSMTYNNSYTKKPQGLLGRIWEAAKEILGLKRETAKKKAHVDFKVTESVDNVYARAHKDVEANLKKIAGEGIEGVATPKDVYEYIWKNQEMKPFFKEYVQNNPDKFKDFKKVPYQTLDIKNLNNIFDEMFEVVVKESKNQIGDEYREHTGKDVKIVKIVRKEQNRVGSAASIAQAETLYRIFGESNYILRKLKEQMGADSITGWMKEFKQKMPQSYERLSKKYGFDLLDEANLSTKESPKTKSPIEVEKDAYGFEEPMPEPTNDNTTSYFEELQKLEQTKPIEPAPLDMKGWYENKIGKKVMSLKFSQMSKELQAEWKSTVADPHKEAIAKYQNDLAEYNRKRIELEEKYGLREPNEFRINAKKMTGVEVDAYYRNVLREEGYKAKNREDFVREASKKILEHIQNHPMGELFRGKADVKALVRMLRNIGTSKVSTVAEKEAALEQIARQLDLMSYEVSVDNGVKMTINTILNTNMRIKSGANKSEKYASPEAMAFMTAAQEGLKNPKSIDGEIARQEEIVRTTQDKINNGEFDVESLELLQARMDDATMRIQGLENARTLRSIISDKNKHIRAINEQYNAISKRLREVQRKRPDLTQEIENYKEELKRLDDMRENVLHSYLDEVKKVNTAFSSMENFAKDLFKRLRETQQAEHNNIIVNAIDDMYGERVPDDMPINSTEFQSRARRNKWSEYAHEWYFRTFSSFSHQLSTMTKQRASTGGYLENEMADRFNTARTKQLELKNRATAMLHEAAERIFGRKVSLQKIYRESAKLIDGNIRLRRYKKDEQTGEWIPTDNYVATENKHGYLSIGEAVDLVMASKQSQGLKSLEKTGIRLEDVMQLEATLNAHPMYRKHLELVYNLRDGVIKYLGGEAQTVHTNEFGLRFLEEANYFPLSIAQVSASKGNPIKPSNFVGTPLTPGYLITRSKITSEYQPQNALDKVVSYSTQMAHWTAFSPMTRILNSVMSSNRFAKNVQANFGKGFYNALRENAMLTVDNYSPAARSNRLWNEIYSFTKLSKVAFRPLTALKQLTSGATYIGYSSSLDYQGLLVKYYGSAFDRRHINWCLENMPRFRERYEQGVAGDIFIGDLQAVQNTLLRDTRNKVYKSSMVMNAYVDAVTVACGSRAVYDYNYKHLKRLGISEENAHTMAIRAAEHEFNLTQASNESMYLSVAQAGVNSSVVYKSLLAFKNPVLAIWRKSDLYFRDMWRMKDMLRSGNNLRSEREAQYIKKYEAMGLDNATAQHAARRDMQSDFLTNVLGIVGSYFLANFSFTAMGQGAKLFSAYSTGNDELFYEELINIRNEAIKRGILGGIPDIPVFSQMVAVTQAIIEGKDWGKALEETGGEMMFGIITSTISDLYKHIKYLFSDDEIKKLEGWGYIMQLPTLALFGIDPKTINNFVKSAWALANGDFAYATAAALQFPQSSIRLFEEKYQRPKLGSTTPRGSVHLNNMRGIENDRIQRARENMRDAKSKIDKAKKKLRR